MNDYQDLKDLVDRIQDNHESTKHKLGLAIQALEYIAQNHTLGAKDSMDTCSKALLLIRKVV